MYKIGIICDKQFSLDALEQEFWSKPEHYPMIFKDVAQFSHAIHTQSTDGVVFGFSNVKNSQLAPVTFIKQKFPKMPLALLHESISETAKLGASMYGNLAVLNYPNEVGSLNGVFNRMFQNLTVQMRAHVRYPTKTHTAIICEESNQKFNGELFNLSKGGAGLEIYGNYFIQGHRISLEIPAAEEGKKNIRRGYVRWTEYFEEDKNGRPPYQKIGVEFS